MSEEVIRDAIELSLLVDAKALKALDCFRFYHYPILLYIAQHRKERIITIDLLKEIFDPKDKVRFRIVKKWT